MPVRSAKTGTIGARAVAVGNAGLFKDLGVASADLESRADALRRDGATAMFVAVDGRPAGIIAVADPIKATAPEALRALRASGLKIVMATGDNETTAKAVARSLEIDQVVGEREDKAWLYSQQEPQGRESLQTVRERLDVKPGTPRIQIGKHEIDEVVSKWTGVPLTSVNEDEGNKLLRMEEELHRRVISQEKAISALSRAIRRSRAGLKNPSRPVGSGFIPAVFSRGRSPPICRCNRNQKSS